MKVRACVCIFIPHEGPLPRGEGCSCICITGERRLEDGERREVRVNTQKTGGMVRGKERHLSARGEGRYFASAVLSFFCRCFKGGSGGDWCLQSPCGRVSVRRVSIISCRSPSGRFDRERKREVCQIL
ncbi:hypothetical protein NPIL_252451 [Nephila pilipes]|uniref:Uncharacterized protein n=1 Tax=Nephila pilipes TaxID=299642 RepID=A0A8X6P1L3_NEPPI|nr:hypothetical protein NPIL_252451 [Nephila pilipes]